MKYDSFAAMQVGEAERAYPGIKKLLDELRDINNRSGMEFDVEEERDLLKIDAIVKFIKSIK